MRKNKKAFEWGWLVTGIIAVVILVVTIFIIGKGTSEANTNLGNFQSCKGQKGECEQSCGPGKVAYFKTLGCGSGDYKDKQYCCIPET